MTCGSPTVLAAHTPHIQAGRTTSPEGIRMTTTHDARPATPVSSIAVLIDEALDATGILPPHERLVELNDQLRAELERLLPIVQQHTDGLPRGGMQWYGRQCVLDDTREVLARDLGTGLRSAAIQVHRLARHCVWLAEYAEEVR
ncbi:DUF6415 family natural product biosynthesis protein [Streptomyces apocyni]|uniref:DUF6415 family natural product biosynthesis protein n=1 Tax=Streptomyces apocyni TaxID=2654677 RepID=UPI0012E99EB1|nr:DUF6415 family natural product biosynthesis protein [Streptomyces apocyni]